MTVQQEKTVEEKLIIWGIRLGVLGFIILLLIFLIPIGMINVAPNQIAVEIDKVGHKVIQEPQGVGYHIYNRWTTDMEPYLISARAYPPDTKKSENSTEYTLLLKTNDGQNVNVDLTIIYSLNANQVPVLHAQVGPDYESQILLPQIRSEARLAIGNYTAEEIYTGKVRDEIQNHIRERLIKAMAGYPAINIHDALMRHFEFSAAFEGQIEAKQLASQQVEINKNKALAQEQYAKQQEAQAKGQKLQAIQQAEGEAQAVKINADAKRYSLEQEAAGNLAKYKAEAEGKRLAAVALGGGQYVVALKFAENIPDKLQIWGVPVSGNSTSIMDVSGVFGNMMKGMGNKNEAEAR